MVDWNALRRRVDQMVDDTFAEPEPVLMIPWNESNESYSTPGGPDFTRKPLGVSAIFVVPGADITGEGGTMGRGLDTKVVQSNVWISVTEEEIGDWTKWLAHDRVCVRGMWYEINYIQPSALGRPNIYLIRLQDHVFQFDILWQGASALAVSSPALDCPGLGVRLSSSNRVLQFMSTLEKARRLDSHLARAIRESKSPIQRSKIKDDNVMSGKLSEFAKRIADTKKRLEGMVDQMTPQLDAIDKQAPDTFQKASAIISQASSDLKEMEDGLTALSNLQPGDEAPTARRA